MKDKINVDEIKKYKSAQRGDRPICFVCGAIEPECGMLAMVPVNIPPGEISDTLCNDCYRKIWKDAEKSGTQPEDLWGLNKI